eukprot:gene17140-19541_t
MAAVVFLAFALAYFFSALVRAITATLSPTLTSEFNLNAQDLGLLAGGYFLGFSLTQLPLGRWLDQHGPKKVILAFLTFAVLGCLAFAWADSFHGLLAARVLCGMGVSACLMAPLMGYRRWFDASTQLRNNSWMLMTGSLGMLAATLPVQWLMPIWGWRALFVMLGVMIAIAMALIALVVPEWRKQLSSLVNTAPPRDDDGSYREIWRSAYFWRMTPIGFFTYGGMVAIQTLWAGPWMTQVAGWTAGEAAQGLFLINFCMLLSFWLWGLFMPGLARRGITVERLIAWGIPLSFVVIGVLVWLGPAVGSAAAVGVALLCVTSTFVSLAQPAVGMAFPSHLAGRALSAYNLVVFAGIFVVQWGIGLLVDAGLELGLSKPAAYQFALGSFGICSVFSCALRACALHVFPDCAAGVLAIDVLPDDPPEVSLAKARNAMAALNSPEVLLLSDVFGATPCNVAQKLHDGLHTRLLAGANLPMLLRSVCYRHEGLEALATRAHAGGTQGVMPERDMPQATTTISNKLGLHARASAKLTKLAGSFPCEVWMSKGERRINAKSIMGVMMLAAGLGSEVVLETSGEREQEGLDALLALIGDKFGEGE